MRTDVIYFELLVMYHGLICAGVERIEEMEEKGLSSNLEDNKAKGLDRPSHLRNIGRAEEWLRRRSKNAVRDIRQKQVGALDAF